MEDYSGAYGYYSSRSGLTPVQNYSLADHMHAYWTAQVGAGAPKDMDGLELAYLHANTTVQMPDIDSARVAYFAQQTGLSGDIGYLASQFFAGATAAPTITEPTRKGHVSASIGTGNTSLTLTPDGTASVGDWMLFTYMAAGSILPTLTGWTLLASNTAFGTRCAAVYGRIRQAGDTSYTATFPSGNNGTQVGLLWGSGADSTVSNWIVGTPETRAAAGGAFNNIAPSITTTADKTLALVVSFEATLATETDISSMTGGTEWYFDQQLDTTNVNTLCIGYVDKSPAGATGNVTITYPNTHASNGLALQVGLPPAS